MERVVKFRGKVVNHDPMTNPENGWVKGYYLQDLDNGVVKHYIFNCPCRWEVAPESVGQFTGLHDYKGREIYEGDVICSELVSGREVLHKIEYKVDDAMFVAKPLEGLDFDYCHIYKHWIWRYGKEVIGNIHDNPNLSTDAND